MALTDLNKINNKKKKLDKQKKKLKDIQEDLKRNENEIIKTEKNILYKEFEKTGLSFEDYYKRLISIDFVEATSNISSQEKKKEEEKEVIDGSENSKNF